MKPDMNQIRYDVERLRKASDRLEELQDAYFGAIEKLKIAENALKLIHTWAVCSTSCQYDMKCIRERAMDALKLMKEPT